MAGQTSADFEHRGPDADPIHEDEYSGVLCTVRCGENVRGANTVARLYLDLPRSLRFDHAPLSSYEPLRPYRMTPSFHAEGTALESTFGSVMADRSDSGAGLRSTVVLWTGYFQRSWE